MKKLLKIALCVAVLFIAADVCRGQGKSTLTGEVAAFLEQYRGKDGFQFEQAKGLALTTFKTMFKAAAGKDKEAKEAVKAMKDITYLYYGDASESAQAEFNGKLEKVLAKAPLKEAKDEKGVSFVCYGLSHSDPDKIQNLLVINKKPAIVICFFFE